MLHIAGDGYTSYSPAEAFESGYTLIDEDKDKQIEILMRAVRSLQIANDELMKVNLP